jgi:type IV pilus assembly protein PilA
MRCRNCSAELLPGAAFCASCGTSVPPGSVPVGELKRPPLITFLAVLQFAGAGILLLMALGASAGLASSAPSTRLEAEVFASVLAVFGIAQAACGFGLWHLRPYGRVIQIVFAVIGLVGIPVGTIIGILVLVYLAKPGVKILFSGRRPSELSPAEWADVSAASQGSGAMVAAMVIIVGLGGVALLGIVAAIAVPGLMRARISGNEASAVGSLRAINSAQATFATTCAKGLYAGSLAGLVKPPRGAAEGFLGADFSADPTVKSGYRIALTAKDGGPPSVEVCNAATIVGSAYFVGAEPIAPNSTGIAFFGANQEGAIYRSAADVPAALPVTFEGAPPGSVPHR